MSFIEHADNGTPVFPIKIGETLHHCTPDNTAAYVHDQRFKDVDHIFISTESGDSAEELGIFIFRGIYAAKFNEVVAEMEAEGYPVNYADTPSDMDWEQYVRGQRKELDDWGDYLDG